MPTKAAADALALLLLAKAAILKADPCALDWSKDFLTSQAFLIVSNRCNGDAHDSTCVAQGLYEKLLKVSSDTY
jgi:hypothetical protein